jgi:hypothetical protein
MASGFTASAGTSKPATDGRFKIGHLVAVDSKLSGNHSRLAEQKSVAFASSVIEGCPDNGSTTGTGRRLRGLRAAASLDGDDLYPYDV